MEEYHPKDESVKTKKEYTPEEVALARAAARSIEDFLESLEPQTALGSQRERDRIADEVASARPTYPPEVIASLRLTKFWASIYSTLLARFSSSTMSKQYALWNDQDREAAQRSLFAVALAAHSTEIVDLVRAAHAALDLVVVDLWDEQRPKAIDEALAKLSQVINLIERGSRL